MDGHHEKIKKYSLASFGIFAVFAALGLVFNYLNPEEATLFFNRIADEFAFVEDLDFLGIFLFIFINNTISIVVGTFLGVLFAVLPILFLAINGFIIGLVAGYVYPTMGGFGLFASLAPHGVFELLALFIGSGIGIHLGLLAINEIKEGVLTPKEVLTSVRNRKFPSPKIKEAYKIAFDLFLTVVLPLLFLAAAIEALLISFL